MIIKSDSPLHAMLPNHNTNLDELLETRRYEEAAQLFTAVQDAHFTNRNLSRLLTVASQICLACAQSRSETKWHEWAGKEAQRREDQLLEVLAELINESLAPEPPNQPSTAWAKPIITIEPPTAIIMPEDEGLPRLVVYTLGTFQVYQDEKLLDEWPSKKGSSIFKYLLFNREHPIHKANLMRLFWPDSSDEAQRNNLNVNIYNLRQALRSDETDFSHIVFQNDCYRLNPDLNIWIDAEQFFKFYKNARRCQQDNPEAAAHEFMAAVALYQGMFLPDDVYERWVEEQRQALQSAYIHALEYLSDYAFERGDYTACIAACQKLLTVEPCLEAAYCRIMRSYSRQGQPYLALRHYHQCVRALKAELDTEPMSETTYLYEQIRSGERI